MLRSIVLAVLILAPSTIVAEPDPGQLVVYLNGDGARIALGERDDAPRFVWSDRGLVGAIDIPPFEGSYGEWNELLACTRRYYAGLPVVFTDRRPPTGDFLMVVVGGWAKDVGRSDVWGVATHNDAEVTERGIGFVFSREHTTSERDLVLCQTIVHETGHLLGLDHTDDCRDMMGKRGCDRVGFMPASRARLDRALARWNRPTPPRRDPGSATITAAVAEGGSSRPFDFMSIVHEGGLDVAVVVTTGPDLVEAEIEFAGPGFPARVSVCSLGNGCELAPGRVTTRFSVPGPGTWKVAIRGLHAGSADRTWSGWWTITIPE